eukprot:gnl/TRDRNA2_/TRDRNA2_158978_c0_seq3.p2 gnl/TRDRNA2_/TRDRNA2_158978_c0~~gnl/TRDRNA2_/TRDRNA2_158978_c0_seq3.p2  ORF type:complete len:168 (-),score=19.59 gnl/TRDRNA2_/TRDRNA2_158978_c0_seq3:38-541(-)
MDDLLAGVKGRVPSDAYCAAALTMEDLFVPSSTWDYIPGRSHYTQRHGAFSFARLCSQVDSEFRPCSRGTYLRRCLKLSSHEIAHMFGVKHCPDSHCRMAATMSLEMHDATSLFFCRRCESKLQRLLHWTAAEQRDRRRRLHQVLDSLNGQLKGEFDEELRTLARNS